jgi:hypothetical protein
VRIRWPRHRLDSREREARHGLAWFHAGSIGVRIEPKIERQEPRWLNLGQNLAQGTFLAVFDDGRRATCGSEDGFLQSFVGCALVRAETKNWPCANRTHLAISSFSYLTPSFDP